MSGLHRHRSGAPETSLVPTGPSYPGVWFTTQDRLRTSIEEALDDLLADLGPGWSYLTTIQDRCDLAVECYVKLYEPNDVTTLGIESRHVAKIAELGAGFGIDYYDFSGPSGVPRPQPH
jgi:hypothetical protein